MSNLLKALKRAEQDREAARQSQAAAQAQATAPTVLPAPLADDSTALPAVMRTQREIGKRADRPNAPTAPVATMPGAYRGIGISVGLVVFLSVGFGLWVRGQYLHKPPAQSEPIAQDATKRTLAATTLIPAALRVHEAGPLELRLDRSVDSVGHNAEHRGKAK